MRSYIEIANYENEVWDVNIILLDENGEIEDDNYLDSFDTEAEAEAYAKNVKSIKTIKRNEHSF